MKDRNYLQLLISLIETPSFSKEETKTAALIAQYLAAHGVAVKQIGNNIIAYNKYFDATKKNILLNSHHDTVKPTTSYTRNPFKAHLEKGKLYGLGVNDAGAALVALIEVFLFFYEHQNLPFNIILAATAEEEISGTGGIEWVMSELPSISFAIVGEPTAMKMAIAERGLLVIDGETHGTPMHVAHYKNDNAIYNALEDIAWLRTYNFEKKSSLLGKTTAVVTKINAGAMHNMIPDHCTFVIDIRVNDCYSLEEIISILKANMKATLQARSIRLQPSAIAKNHPIINIAHQIGIATFGSRTLSDMALLSCDAVKIGPGDSLRSHTADEYILLDELEAGIAGYKKILLNYITQYETLG